MRSWLKRNDSSSITRCNQERRSYRPLTLTCKCTIDCSRRACRGQERTAEGADLIKVIFTGGFTAPESHPSQAETGKLGTGLAADVVS